MTRYIMVLPYTWKLVVYIEGLSAIIKNASCGSCQERVGMPTKVLNLEFKSANGEN